MNKCKTQLIITSGENIKIQLKKNKMKLLIET
jgi:hypothetical protein